MSIELDELNEERDAVRKRERELTERIKQQRKTDSDDLKESARLAKLGAPDINAYTLLKRENIRLRMALTAEIKNSDGKTYERLGKSMGISTGRATQIYKSFLWELGYMRDGVVSSKYEETKP